MRPRLSDPVRKAGYLLIGTVLGFMFLFGGINAANTTAPNCGGSTMEQGDVCHHWDDDWSDDQGYEEELRGARAGGTVMAVVGFGILAGTGIAALYWARRKQFSGQTR